MEEKKTYTDEELAAMKKELASLSLSMKENNQLKKEYSNRLDLQKERFKELADILGVNEYRDEFVKITITDIDKSFLREEDTLNYLKANNLTEYVHTKEFFDYAELEMAAVQKKLKPQDLAQFRETKTERRINIK